MTIQDVIEAGIKGGWKGTPINQDLLWKQAPIEVVILDPSFWQALGKSLEWSQPVYFKGKYQDASSTQNWLGEMHRLIDHLANGESIESFFRDLV